ncbi:MAG: RidA family protein [Ginsengibacter sp.]
MPQTPDELLKLSGLTLSPAPEPKGVYKPFLQVGNLIYVSGHGPVLEDGILIKGKVGVDINADAAKLAARQVGLTILSTLQANLGSLNKIKRVIKVLGMVNCTPDFQQHPFVINGCSELFAMIWGNGNGVGVRSAVGMGSLPDNIPVEIEAIFELSNEASEMIIAQSVTEIQVNNE